jgi:hypothetical protein
MDVPTATAITTAVVAFIVAIITLQQQLTNRARLRHELFDRRFVIYEKIATFLCEVLQAGRVPAGRETEFLRETNRAYFVFNCDKDVQNLITEIYRHANALHALDATLIGLVGSDRSSNVEKQRVIKEWFQTTFESLDKTFAKYLRLQH